MRRSRHQFWIGSLLSLLVPLIVAASASAAGPSWSFESTSYDFTPTPAGGAPSAPHEFVLTNTGDEAITISKFVRGEGVDEAFERTESTCHNGAVLEPGASCHVDIAFAPTTSGRQTGYVKAETLNEEPPLAKVELEGEGVGPAVSIEREEVKFGSIPEGASSRQTVIVENLGSGPLRIYGVSVATWDYWGSTLEYPATNPFALKGGSCKGGEVLAVSEACTVEVAFAPSKQGRFGSILLLEDNASPHSPQQINLEGTGIAPPPLTTTTGTSPGSTSTASSVGQTETPAAGPTLEGARHGYEPPARLWGSYVATKASSSGHADPFRDVSRVTVGLGEVAGQGGSVNDWIHWKGLCNSSGARVRVTSSRLVPSRISSTRRRCTEPASKEDRWLVRFFGSDPSWHLQRPQLVLRAGKKTLWLRRAGA